MQHTVPHSPTSPRTGTATNVSVPESPSRKSFLAMVGVVNFLGRARKTETIDGNKQLKPGHMIFVSGEPQTHPCVARCLEPEQLCKPVQFAESFVCAGGVNVVPLLVATRTTLLNRIGPLGANTLTDEQWDVSISTLKAGIYKVQVRYFANATQSSARNPVRPVALEKARGIPGLMTILKRSDT